jgi:hypothetical protein
MTPNVPNPSARGRLYLTSADPTVKPALDFCYFVRVCFIWFTSTSWFSIFRRTLRITTLNVWSMASRLRVKLRRLPRLATGPSQLDCTLRTELIFRLKKEVAPGPYVTSDEALSYYGRKASHTVYHPVPFLIHTFSLSTRFWHRHPLTQAGTCKMGAVNDSTAVVDPLLCVRGLKGIRVIDASVFPVMVVSLACQLLLPNSWLLFLILQTANPMVTVLIIGEPKRESTGLCRSLTYGRRAWFRPCQSWLLSSDDHQLPPLSCYTILMACI